MKPVLKWAGFGCILAVQIYVFFQTWQKYEVNTYFKNTDKAWAIISFYILASIIITWLSGVIKLEDMKLVDAAFDIIISTISVNLLTYFQLCMLKDYPYLYSIKVFGLIAILNSALSCLILSVLYILINETPDAILIYGDGKDFCVEDFAKKIPVHIKENIYIEKTNQDIMHELYEKISQLKYVVMANLDEELYNSLLLYCFEKDITCYTPVSEQYVLVKSAGMIQKGCTPVLLHKSKKKSFPQEFIKRVMDIFISLSGILFTLPLTIFVSFLIYLYDKEPVLFWQERYTKDGKLFCMCKFRSIGKNGITPIGKVLRKTHIDEIPQLFNVLKGDMSIVGPRPEERNLYEKYVEEYPEYKYRLKVKAGLTGYMQVYGKHKSSLKDKLLLDLYYICNYSLLLDIKIIILTFKTLLEADGDGED